MDNGELEQSPSHQVAHTSGGKTLAQAIILLHEKCQGWRQGVAQKTQLSHGSWKGFP